MAKTPGRVWLTADQHFGHANMTLEGNHPFEKHRPFKTIKAMDDYMVAAWNKLVGPNDRVYIVGDFCLGGLDQTIGYFARLNGHLMVLPGSHDYRWTKNFPSGQAAMGDPRFASERSVVSANGHSVLLLPEMLTVKLPGIRDTEKYTLTLTMCHYQMASWHQSHHGTLHVFGHHHGARQGIGRSMDVGADTNRLRPYALEAVVTALLKKPIHGKYALDALEGT